MPNPKPSKQSLLARKRLICAPLALLPVLTMSACVTTQPTVQPVPEVHNIYPSMPAGNLMCTPEPVPGQILTDVQAAQFAEAVRVAGQDCRNKLGTVAGIVHSWPK